MTLALVRLTGPFLELIQFRLLQIRPVPKSKLFGTVAAKFYRGAGCPSYCPTNSVKAPQTKQQTTKQTRKDVGAKCRHGTAAA